MINSRHLHCDNAEKAAKDEKKGENCDLINMMGHMVELNVFMRSTNGNGKRRLLFSHINFRGGDLTNCPEKRNQWVANIAQTRPDVIGLSETKIGTNENKVCDIAGYTWERKEDSERISVMVNANLDYRRRRDLEVPGFAGIWIELCPRNKNPVLICQLYREWKLLDTPGSGHEPEQQKRWSAFLEKFKQVAASNQELHVIGDVNLDRQKWRQVVEDNDDEVDEGYGSDTSTGPSQRSRRPRLQPGLQSMVDSLYEDILNAHGVVQLQKKISWSKVDKHGKILAQSCLDLYFTNRVARVSELRLSEMLHSDHLQVMGYRKTNNKMPQPSVIRKRKWAKINWTTFNSDMQKSGVERWVLKCEDINEASQLLTAAARVHLDKQQEVKTYQLKSQYAPWIDESTKMIIARKKTLFEIWKRTGQPEDWKLYRRQSNFLVKTLKQRKTHYLKQKLRSTVESQDVWKETRHYMHIGGAGPPVSLVVNGELTSNPQVMAEKQNDFFISKVKGIDEKIPPTTTDPLSYTRKFLKDKEIPEFNFMSVVSEKEVENIISELKNTTSTGHDDINVVGLKKMLPSMLTSITHIINLSLKQGVFPEIWKLAKVVPLFKNNGDKSDSKCYRPIALLPVMSKILEKFISRWLNQHMEKNRLWSDRQHGYRGKRSTATALLQLQEEVLKRFEEGHDVAVSSYDSSAAFDTLTHSILLEKLKLYGCSKQVIKWFESYLSDRWQYCEINGKKSSTKRITQGVFQGSVLGPLLYILYVNCISILEDNDTKLSLYADDVNAATRLTKNKYENKVRISVMAAQLQRYMDSNHLKFNGDKTKLIVKTRSTKNNHGYLDMKLGDKLIEQEETTKVLGVVIGKDEKYKEYLVNGKKSVMSFLNTRHSMLKILSKFADLKVRKALAEGLILSKINYCLTVWGSTTEEIMQKMHILVNDVVRTVFGIGRNRFTSLAPLYQKLRWLPVRQLLQYHDLITVQSIVQNDTPQDLAAKFQQQHNHSHNTRASSQAYRLSTETTSRLAARSKGFVCRAAAEFQKLPSLITESKTLPRAAFKDYVKSDIGQWEMSPSTENVLEYLETLKNMGEFY